MSKAPSDNKVNPDGQSIEPRAPGVLEAQFTSEYGVQPQITPPPAFGYGVPPQNGESIYHGASQQPPPGTYAGNKRGRIPARCCFIWLCSILTTIIILAGLAIFIFWCVSQPTSLDFDVDNVRVDNLVFNSAGSNTVLSPVTTFQLVARNPNKKTVIVYNDIYFDVSTTGVNIGSQELLSNTETIYQGHKDTTYIAGNVQGASVKVNDDTRNAIKKAESDGSLRIEILSRIFGRFKIDSWLAEPPSKFEYHVHCKIKVNASIATGSQIVSKDCDVDLVGDDDSNIGE